MPEKEERNSENEYDSESDCSQASFLSYLSSANEDDDQHLHLQEILTSTLFKSPPPASSSTVAVAAKTELPTEEEQVIQVLITCKICVQAKETRQMFRNLQCDHSFCYECVTKHVTRKIQESITVIPCPVLNCKGVLDIDACRVLLPKDVLVRWNDAHFLAVSKFYCPYYKDCSAMMILDNGIEEIRRSECPFWHYGVKCEEYQNLNEDERGREDLIVLRK